MPKGQTSTPLPAPDKELVQASGIPEALVALFGSEPVLRFLATTDFPRRAVATLDSLGRDHAPVAAWPVLPAPGRFLVDNASGSQYISERNSRRYEPFVAFIAAVDAARAVDLYRRMYPLLMQAYREIGFGGQSLNDRVFEVIDLLLATPEPSTRLEVSLTQVIGPIPSASPWTRYEYADGNLQRLAAGQKILLRVGPENRKKAERETAGTASAAPAGLRRGARPALGDGAIQRCRVRRQPAGCSGSRGRDSSGRTSP
jgi:hypothetical protein